MLTSGYGHPGASRPLGPRGEVAPMDSPHGPTAPSTALVSPSGDTQDPWDLPGLVRDLGPRAGARG